MTDANVVLGYLPKLARLGGDLELDRGQAEQAVQKIADALGLSLEAAAAGIVDIVNENIFGALRLVSVEQGYDPRDFALIAFGGAGPLHGNALGRLMGAWPVIIPPGPGVLCAYGDATTRVRNESARTFIRRFAETDAGEIKALFAELAASAAEALDREDVPRGEQSVSYQVDVRYHGQGLLLTLDVDLDALERDELDAIGKPFDEMHRQLFTFALTSDKEIVNLRAVVQGKAAILKARDLAQGGSEPPAAARQGEQSIYVDGANHAAVVYRREELAAGNRIDGPAIVVEMDATALILPGHTAEVDPHGNLLIRPADA